MIVMRLEYLDCVEEYKNRLEPHMDLLQQQGWWRKVSKCFVLRGTKVSNVIYSQHERM